MNEVMNTKFFSHACARKMISQYTNWLQLPHVQSHCFHPIPAKHGNFYSQIDTYVF